MPSGKEKITSLLGMFALLIILTVSPGAFASSSSSILGGATEVQNAAFYSPAPILFGVTPSQTCGIPTSLCPSMLTTAYDMNAMHTSGINGSGQSIVIDDACGDPTITSDLKTFDKTFNLPNPKLTIYEPEDKPTCTGWDVEVALDVEWSHVVAPAAAINLVVSAKPNNELYQNWFYSLSHHLGNQISDSWGGNGNCPTIALNALGNATADHVTVLASAGDSGAWGKDHGKNQQPADCKEVLTVGGTTLEVKKSGAYIGEAAWGGSGGGYVTGTPEPKYESSVNIKDKFHLLGKSDVSADANPGTGVQVYDATAGGWFTVGGTSVSCPLWAGFLADVNQVRAAHGLHPAGFVTPFLYDFVYGVNGTATTYHADFHDVKLGNDGWPAGKGWDVPTGLGSFIASKLVLTIGKNPSA
jgi:subtilase family serine protease